ncbi:MAG: MBL fold metallo-hydrolase, partial [Deltaproteobacteria bacterium]|nr:MBL fold metallo-hydrolase [Deltaproteobacteria bacterium]
MKKAIFLLMMSVMVFAPISCEKILETGLKKQMNRSRADMLTDGNLHVVLVGSGGPLPNTERVSVSTAVIAGGEFILVDTGPGTARNALLQNLPLGKLSAVFLTH